MTTEMDLVGAASGLEQPRCCLLDSALQPFDLPHLNLLTPEPIKYWGDIFPTTIPEIDETTLGEKFHDLLCATQKCATVNHRLAFEENGLIFFAPG
jgi:hypothetical protein